MGRHYPCEGASFRHISFAYHLYFKLLRVCGLRAGTGLLLYTCKMAARLKLVRFVAFTHIGRFGQYFDQYVFSSTTPRSTRLLGTLTKILSCFCRRVLYLSQLLMWLCVEFLYEHCLPRGGVSYRLHTYSV